jgi:hypothetical protein
METKEKGVLIMWMIGIYSAGFLMGIAAALMGSDTSLLKTIAICWGGFLIGYAIACLAYYKWGK